MGRAVEWTIDASARPSDGSVRRDVVVLIIAAALVRLIFFDRIGVDHFDAGAYAMTAGAIANGDVPRGVYPLLHFLSPPLYFALGAALMSVLGTGSALPLAAVSATAGVATVVVVYLAGRHWFGRGVGGAAAWLLLMADFHVLYSRTALTDVLFCALFLCSLVAFAFAEERQSNGLAALAGALIGLSWNTKYHGWLAGVIAGVAVLPAFLSADGRQRRGIVVRLAIAAAIAISMYLPWALFVQSRPGGYAQLTAEHARFLRPASLFENALSQVRAQRYLEGWMARLSPLAAIAWIGMVIPPARRWPALLWSTVLIVLALAIGVTTVIGVLAFAAPVVLFSRSGIRRPSHWFLLAFFGVFTVLTPLYTPYPRLLLPWFVSAVMLSGVTIEWLVTAEKPVAWRTVAPIGLLAIGVVLVTSRGVRPAAIPWRTSNAMQDGAAQVSRVARDTLPIFVIGEPGVVFELRRLGRVAWHIDQPADISRSLPSGSSFYLVGGIYSRRIDGPASLASWLAQHPDVGLAGTAPVATVGDVRMLDDFSTDEARTYRQGPSRSDYDLNVYRVSGTNP